ncbi:hypothetical protein BH11PSE12_BH11PSE12_00860 [soil metagenome]
MPRKQKNSPPSYSKQGGVNSASPSALTGRWWRSYRGAATIIAVVLLLMAIWYAGADSLQTTAATAHAGQAGSFLSMPPTPENNPASAAAEPDAAQREARRQAAISQLVLADHSLCSYRDATKYPNNSRPISEHPDQIYPNRPVQEQHAMRKEGGGTDAAVQIQTSQSRVFMASGEAVVFTMKAMDKEGKTMPMFVNLATARGMTFGNSRAAPQIALSINDEGRNGDAYAGDGLFSGTLPPDQTGFASFDGTIRTEVKYNVDGRAGLVIFDVIYSPQSPASWVGPVREALEGGSLHFYLKANVRIPGRYIASGRVDDAKGKPFALVTFNDLLGQGSNEIRLTVVGKLLRDQEAVFPLTLRDVDAYLLKENSDPDRALMPRIEGAAYLSKNYPLKSFTDAEWSGEERSRYLTEYTRDLDLAKAALIALNPEQARMPFPESECSQTKKASLNH